MTDEQKLQQKWEKILRDKGLGVDQPLTQNSEGDLAEVEEGPRDDNARLRKVLDGSDKFMDGYEIKTVRTIDRDIPDWALNLKEVKRVLLTVFPKISLRPGNKKRNFRAGRWARIIQLYYRMQLPQQIVMKEMGLTEPELKSTLQRMNRAALGLTGKGKARKRRYPSHTP
jgi:hypothetical protein